MEDLPRNMTVNQAVKALNISRAHLYTLKRRKQIAFIKIGAKVMIPENEVKRIALHGTLTADDTPSVSEE